MNVYVPEVWLSATAGLHVPVTPFEEVVDKTGTVPPAQIVSDDPNMKAGVITGFTVTVKLAGTAHNPVEGVNV